MGAGLTYTFFSADCGIRKTSYTTGVPGFLSFSHGCDVQFRSAELAEVISFLWGTHSLAVNYEQMRAESTGPGEASHTQPDAEQGGGSRLTTAKEAERNTGRFPTTLPAGRTRTPGKHLEETGN